MERRPPAVTIVVSGRNDDYGGDFGARLLRTATHNTDLLDRAGLTWEYLFVEWNPLTDRALLSLEFTTRIRGSRAVIVPGAVHDAYSMHGGMPFHEMPAKNAGIRRATAPWVIVSNADVLFHPDVLERLARGTLDARTLYRARRVDVPPALDWTEMQNPRVHLPSGEGDLPPVDVLGAGGDFCLASRSLWHDLRGFDERVRFTTRAKDWQFFLSARQRRVPIEFLGTVFHLDHAGGFRNTPAKVRRTAAAHFGGPWDIEFGLPTLNPSGWGLGDLGTAVAEEGGRIEQVVDVPRYSPHEQAAANDLQDLVSGDDPDWLSASWLHIFFEAWRQGRGVRLDLESPRTTARLLPWLSIAAEAGIAVTGDLEVPRLDGFTVQTSIDSAKAAGARAPWLVRERDGLLVLSDGDSPVSHWPERRPPDDPSFNPLLARRLLRAWMRLAEVRPRRVLLYGAGSHTRELLALGWPDAIRLDAVVVSAPASGTLGGLPVRCITDVTPQPGDAVLLSSVSYEPDMAVRAQAAGFRHVVSLYGAPDSPMTGAVRETLEHAS